MIHVFPVDDEREHDISGTGCWCGPNVFFNDLDGSAFSELMVVHHSADGREFVEEAERIKAETESEMNGE
jgi:hypothetical protein